MLYLVDGEYIALFPSGWLWGGLAIGLAVFIAFYVLRSIGIYTLAKRGGYKNAYLGWIPFAWIYLAARLCGNVTFFGKKINSFAVILVVFYTVTQALVLAYYFLCYFPLAGYYLQGGTVYMVTNTTGAGLPGTRYPLLGNICTQTAINLNYPYSQAFLKTFNICVIISNILDIINIVLMVTFYFALFGKYWPRHSFAASMLSIFGLFGPFVFAIRKNKPMTREEFMRTRFGFYQNPYGNPYNNPYGNPNGNPDGYTPPKPPETPFSEFAERGEVDPGDPFGEFSENEDKDNGRRNKDDNRGL